MDFQLTEEQRAIQEMVHDFAEKEIVPRANEIDQCDEFPADLFRKMGEQGLMGLPFPAQYGGGGADMMSQALAVEEVARASGSVGLTYAAHLSLGCAPIYNFGTEEQKKKWLTPLAQGEALGALALTESKGGSDLAGSVATTAVLKGSEWILNGSKMYVTSGAVARSINALCITDKGKGHRGLSMILVPRSTPGLVIGKVEEKMGLHGSLTTQIFFEDCRVPKENLLGAEGAGFKQAMITLDGGRIGIGAMALGLGRAALEASIQYAQERQAFGKPIADFQAIQWMIADAAMELEAARWLVAKAAYLKDKQEKFSQEAAMAKLYASEAADRACWKAIQIHGGAGYLRDFPVERFYRDNRLTLIGEGTSEILRMVIARNILKASA
ncbi:MAG: acyl-CoA dehydrogenase family protein [Chloroflexota bacterium]|nr:acyl-CoA dehydrogenase family protein [Chloroflexota bacterium]